jgi:hypothetical protein
MRWSPLTDEHIAVAEAISYWSYFCHESVFTYNRQRFVDQLSAAIKNPRARVFGAFEKDQLLGYAWVELCDGLSYTPETFVDVKLVHLRMTASSRLRVEQLTYMIDHWETWGRENGAVAATNSTVLENQSAYLRLHRRAGYVVSGSFCFKRIDNVKINTTR